MKCPECKKDFEKTRPWQRYCSDPCGQRQRNKRRAKRVKKALQMADEHSAERHGAMVGEGGV